MTYALEACVAPDEQPAREPLDALIARARAGIPRLAHATVHGPTAAACDGDGFVLEGTLRGARVLAGTARGPADEWLMERVALAIAGRRGEVVDKHTGRRWTAALLNEWLGDAALLSGRALAANEARIARRGPTGTAHDALQGFAERAARVAARVRDGGGSHALGNALRDELGHYASRPAFAWTVARGLAAMGDFSRLEALTRTPSTDPDAPDAFAVAAEFGAAALPLFAQALAHADPNHRRAAARALHRVKSPDVLALVARALEDRRSTVREAVLESGFDAVLALDPGARVLGPVLARLEHDASTLVRRLAARARG